ncbi:MAG: MBOAT family protein, partial [Geobacteraceae bacterium]|nr:MBOAT family protein [Geobacteraceae bacterium]
WLVLLAGSGYFYLTLKQPLLLVILVLVSGVSYLCGIVLGRTTGAEKRRMVFWSAIAANLLVLIGMKYLPFLAANLNSLSKILQLGKTVPQPPPLVAIGVSYFVFQAISYLIDVYWRLQEPERHPGIFALYLSFFPKLLQGPIERAGDLLPQLKVPFRFDPDNLRIGLLTFAWGLFKKAVIADRLALYVNAAYGDLPGHAGLPLLIATYLYALQIYYDFSGYTDMALGSARMFNISLTQNFRTPYLATSVTDFWRRWHISFSRWILDYLFRPLQMQWRNLRQTGTVAALIVTFLLSGLWHGASWCFVVWGGLHGLYLAGSVVGKPLKKKLRLRYGLERNRWYGLWQILLTFHLVCLAWIFFRSPTIGDAWFVVTHLVGNTKNALNFLLSRGVTELVIVSVSLAILWTVWWVRERMLSERDFFAAPEWFRWSIYGVLAALLLLFTSDSNTGFIYFQF